MLAKVMNNKRLFISTIYINAELFNEIYDSNFSWIQRREMIAEYLIDLAYSSFDFESSKQSEEEKSDQ